MEGYTVAIVAVSCTVLALIALWLFLIAPRPRKKAVAPFLRPYAHRGLWSKEAPENSLAAFRLAAEQGFAIELDVQLSRDGEVMVFHDYTLTRMCGVDLRLSDLTAAELATHRLGGTDLQIPTLRAVLEAVDGRVPLLIELKGESGNTALCPALSTVLADYPGKWCVESFNPLLLRWWKRHRPDVVRGLLSTDLIKEKQSGSLICHF
jgi:glycerophosphoryl diester phosphodiesterase